MLGKNIKIHLRRVIEDWAASVENEEIKNIILNEVIITGGAIVSLLQNEEPKDYDVYIRDIDSLIKLATYYVNSFTEEDKRANVFVQRCRWDDENEKWLPNPVEKSKDDRVRVFVRSRGATGEDFDPYSDNTLEYRNSLKAINSDIKKKNRDTKPKDRKPYRVKFLTNNAISLSDKIQIVMRFHGEPEQIHENYDFVHCCSYYTIWNDKLELPSRALEAILNKELHYVGSKYPLCSIIRTRKFMKRGWHINAGQYVKMALQLNELNLRNIHVFEEQLIGVDSTYFDWLIDAIKGENLEKADTTYLIGLIDQVFEEKQIDAANNMCEDDIDENTDI